MKNLIMAIMLSFAIMLAPGCTSLTAPATSLSGIILNGPILIDDIETVYADLSEAQKTKAIFSLDDIDQLEKSLSVYDMIKTEYETLIALEMMPDTVEAMAMWKKARNAYTDAMKIVNSKREFLSARSIVNIEVMDAHAVQADDDVMTLLQDPTAKNISEALKIISGLIKIGAKVAVLL